METSNGSGAASSENKASIEPVLAVMYLVQYIATIGCWLMDKIGGNRVEAAARKGNTNSLSLLFGRKKAS